MSYNLSLNKAKLEFDEINILVGNLIDALKFSVVKENT